MAKPSPPRRDGATADALIVFGISGDLAKKMTFRALYRLEARGKLDCRIIGVAIENWGTEELLEHAREAIGTTVADPDEDIFDRLAARITYLSGDYAEPATFQRLAAAIGAARQPVFYLEVPPRCLPPWCVASAKPI